MQGAYYIIYARNKANPFVFKVQILVLFLGYIEEKKSRLNWA